MDRKYTVRINYLIENCLPPVIGDSSLVARLINFATGRGFRLDPDITEPELVRSNRPRDYSAAQETFVLSRLVGRSVLEIGSGQGWLLERIKGMGYAVRGLDPNGSERCEDVDRMTLEEASLPDRSWDTVVSLHTLEHIPDCWSVMAEMLRVACRRVVVVVPRQRYRRYTYDTHVRFFPDERQLKLQLGLDKLTDLHVIDLDWCLSIDIEDAHQEGIGR